MSPIWRVSLTFSQFPRLLQCCFVETASELRAPPICKLHGNETSLEPGTKADLRCPEMSLGNHRSLGQAQLGRERSPSERAWNTAGTQPFENTVSREALAWPSHIFAITLD